MRNIIFILLAIMIVAAIILIEKKDKVLTGDGAFHYPGLSPAHLLISPDASFLYASTADGIIKIELDTMETLDTFPLSDMAYEMSIDQSGAYLYCIYNPGTTNVHNTGATNNGQLARINTVTGETVNMDLSPANVYSCTLDDSCNYLYVSGGTWPEFGEFHSAWDYPNHYGTGRIFEIQLSDFSLVRTADIAAALESGLSYQGGKLVVMSPEITPRPLLTSDRDTLGSTCHIIDVNSLSIEHTLGVQAGDNSTSCALPGDTYVMLGFNSDSEDGVGFGLLNVETGEVEEWIVTDQNPFPPDWTPEGGGFMMAVDTANNLLYSTMHVFQPIEQPYYRMGLINLNDYSYTDWYIEPFRIYGDMAYDALRDKIYLSAPLDDLIKIIDPPEYQPPPLIPPVACFTYNPQSGSSPLMVTIDNCSYDEDGEIVRIECDWDADGEIDEVMEGNPDVLLHTFNEPGTTDFVLTVVDNDELAATWIGSVDVM